MKGRKFNHWLSRRMPPRIDDPLLILESVQAGDRQAIKQMVNGHLRLAAGLVALYYNPGLGGRHADSDSMVSAAFYGVANAVQRIADGHLTHDNPSAYIAVFIHGEIRRWLADRNVSVKTVPLHHHLDDHNAVYDDFAIQNVIGDHPDTTIDIEEEINALVNDRRDAEIVDLLRFGWNGVEIAERLGIDKSNVSRRVSRIRKELVNE